MSHYVVTSKLNTVVAVRNTGSDLSHGKWKSQPGGSTPVGTNQIFVAENHDGSVVPPVGWGSYVVADGTVFTFNFADEQTNANHCSSSMSNVQGPWTIPTPDYPNSGKTWTVTFYIGTAQAFFDAPVFPDDLVRASKCSAYTEERVKGLIGGRQCVYLRDAFKAADLQPIDLVWCATHPLFLTPSSKALLARDLAQLAVRELSQAGRLPASLFDDTLQANKDFMDGTTGTARLGAIRRQLAEKEEALRKGSVRDSEIIGVVSALTDPNPETGWIHAVSSFLNNTDDGQQKRRVSEVVNIVRARL